MSRRGVLEEKLLQACSQGNLPLVAECLENGANMNMVCSNGRTALGVAAEIGDLAILELLLGGADPGASSSKNNSNLGYFVVVHSDSNDELTDTKKTMPGGIDFDDFNNSLVQSIPGLPILSSPDSDINDLEWDKEFEEYDDFVVLDRDPWSDMYMWYANILSQTGDLLSQHPAKDAVDGEDQFGCTALHYAAACGHRDVILRLLNSGCKINVEDTDNFTPLHLAASKDRVDIVELLLSHGANPHHRSTDGITPLHVCASRGLLQNAQALVAAGAAVNAVDMSDRTPLYLAVSRRQHAVVKFLIVKGAKVNLEEIHGYTPLFEAVCVKDVPLVEWKCFYSLLSGYTPLFEAVCVKDVPLVEILLAAGAKVTQSHHLLHYAILHQHEAMVKVLVRAGSIINLRNESGDTPLMLAVKTRKHNIVRMLLENGASVHCTNHLTRQTALQDTIMYISRDCAQFSQMFSLLEEFGWNWTMEKHALSFAITNNNDHAVATLVRRSDILTDPHLPEKNEMLNLLLLRNNRLLVELFVQAGFDVNSFQPCSAIVPLVPWFKDHLKNPLPLQNLARIRIRSALRSQIFSKLEQLYLPPRLKAFIRLEDICCPCQLRKEEEESIGEVNFLKLRPSSQ